jgi:hypothetical protein
MVSSTSCCLPRELWNIAYSYRTKLTSALHLCVQMRRHDLHLDFVSRITAFQFLRLASLAGIRAPSGLPSIIVSGTSSLRASSIIALHSG